MRSKTHTAIIVEGTSREPLIIENLIKNFFKQEQCTIISLPVGQNIYMLWKQMEKDEFVTDIIEVVRDYSEVAAEKLAGSTRDDFAEVFLFFDYDGHQNNLSEEQNADEILKQMLEVFDDETENGKLYVSYPMVEAVRDYFPNSCKPWTQCYWKIDELRSYKNKTGVDNQNTSVKDYGYEHWCEILNVYSMRVSCLFEQEYVIKFEEYRKRITPLSIFMQQLLHIQEGKVFVLSAFPAFLLEYHKEPFWKKHVKQRKLCSHGGGCCK